MNQPYSELIEKIEECCDVLVLQQVKRDEQLARYERYKLVLLAILIASVWIMFLLTWNKLDEIVWTLRPSSLVIASHEQIRENSLPDLIP